MQALLLQSNNYINQVLPPQLFYQFLFFAAGDLKALVADKKHAGLAFGVTTNVIKINDTGFADAKKPGNGSYLGLLLNAHVKGECIPPPGQVVKTVEGVNASSTEEPTYHMGQTKLT